MTNTPQAGQPGEPSAAGFELEKEQGGVSNQEGGANGQQELLPQAPLQQPEQVAQQSADTVREKLVQENAGLASAASVQTTTQQPNAAPVTIPAQGDFKGMEPDEQVDYLLRMAHDNGLNHAFSLANSTQDAYVIDKFHDELVNKVRHNKEQGTKA